MVLMFSFLKKCFVGFLALISGLVFISIFVVLFLVWRYDEENIEISGMTFVLRTDTLSGGKCIYPARKYVPGELERIAMEISKETDLDMCFQDWEHLGTQYK